ncbi:hypothetical protein TPB0596_09250 [Tsukamurella pulmonis]|uniref:Uncharacterized protein n=1 Tax=Tsukamurella pulmonis TaxID=47312 RepID=A0A1H1H9A7_9ACTN|nr:hypothetical protein [Tsukamurella pulmonis]BDD81162.1 hypothetical protein TPB0596_09250 [Tsukamurella pulmonis]SDR21656.1 hypothetical protein SAMN04489765_3905 [Tsukamurella pulmonis]SUP15654.1 Uncharacterised protein [Tsukamurella pulmonis]
MNPSESLFDPYTETAERPVVDRGAVERPAIGADPVSAEQPRPQLPLKPYIPTY